MFSEGNILYIQPFVFKNGNKSKPKYFIILKDCGNELLVASLPTSQDHVPSFIEKNHGCLSNDNYSFNCYYFDSAINITENGFCFPISTYIYGEQVDTYELKYLIDFISEKPASVEIKGKLDSKTHLDIIECITNSAVTRRKIKRLLSK